MYDDEREIIAIKKYLINFLQNIDQELMKRKSMRSGGISWVKLVPDSLVSGSAIKLLEDGCLIVSCKHSTHLQLLNLHKAQIIKQLKIYYPTLQIMSIQGIIDKNFVSTPVRSIEPVVVLADEQEDELFKLMLQRLKQVGQQNE